jgi:hypothetical protein
MLDEDSVPPIDRERLTQIKNQMPVLIRNVRSVRNAVLIIWIAIGLLVTSVPCSPTVMTACGLADGALDRPLLGRVTVSVPSGIFLVIRGHGEGRSQ